MAYMEEKLVLFKQTIEKAIIAGGAKGKTSAIRSSILINFIHDAVKYELVQSGIDENNIFPRLGRTKPEIKLAGLLKQKRQDICVLPRDIKKSPTVINWGPLSFENKRDPYGFDFSTRTLAINVRSQMSSLGKNSDTLFERTFAEAQNLHQRYHDIVLGEVYLIPTHEYDDKHVKSHKVGFKDRRVNIEKYISFFNAINNRKSGGDNYAYERCALLVVDFRRDVPKLYNNSEELKRDNLISNDFNIEYETLAFNNFADDIIKIYSSRYDLKKLLKEV